LSEIHPTAWVAPTAQLGEGTSLGPFAVVEENVVLGEGNQIGPYVMIHGGTTLGSNNVIHAGAVLGGDAQDKKGGKGEGKLFVGDHNVIGEYVTFHRGTEHGGGITRIGSNGIFQTFAHVGHDTEIRDHVTLGPLTAVAGHVLLETGVRTGAHVGIHQFVRMGSWSEGKAFSGHTRDIPPFCVATGNPSDRLCLREDLGDALKLDARRTALLEKAFQIMTETKKFADMVEALEGLEKAEEIGLLLAFLREEGHRFPERRRGILRRAVA